MKKRQTKTLKEELRQQRLNLKLAVADILSVSRISKET